MLLECIFLVFVIYCWQLFTPLSLTKWNSHSSMIVLPFSIFFIFHFFPFIFISWRLITLQYVVVFAIHWHESAMDLHIFPIPIPSPASLPIPSLWVFPVHQPQALVSCIQPGLVICFTLDSILDSMLFSQNIPPSPSPRVPKSVLYICVKDRERFTNLHVILLQGPC